MAPSQDTLDPSKPVEFGNSLDLATYKTQIMNQQDFEPISCADILVHIQLESSASLSATDHKACFELIRVTSFQDYNASSTGWHPRKKLKEMRLPDLRYMLIRANDVDSVPSALPLGFASFMLTYEDGREVVYVYEIHLAAELRGSGMGKRLMHMIEQAGQRAGMEASMLTVFTSNERALAFYKRLGYKVDDYSPEARVFRNGTVKEPDYVILSKSLRFGLGKPDA